MKLFFGLTLAITTAFATAAVAAAQDQRVRGAIDSIDNDSLTIKSRAGENMKVMLAADTKYVYVVKSSLANVDQGKFIGTATKTADGSLTALEVVVFPESMRGTAAGHYAWDRLPDLAQSGGGMVSSSMTNGNVAASSSSGGGKLVQSSMTNGNIESTDSNSRAKEITVSYKGGQQKITVPPTAPIVAFQPADKSAIKQGAKVFIIAADNGGELTAAMVAVGKNGVTPPM